ncbi:MAG TPA: MFS transporter [Thermoplasmata archaeon]|nr:MFS transporter [Thermoplasmata archaeon]
MSGPVGAEPPPPRSRGPFRWIAFVLAVTAFGAGIPTPLYATYEARYGFGAGVLGLVFGTYTIGVLVTMFLVAPRSDLVGRRPILLVGMVLTALSGVVFVAVNGVIVLALARVASGLAVGATTSTATAAMARLEPGLDQHHVARVSVAANFGGVAAGVLASGLLVAYVPYPTTVVYVVLIALSVVGALAVLVVPETVQLSTVRRRLAPPALHIPPEIRRSFWIAALALASCYSIYGFFGALAPTFVRVALGFGGTVATALVVATMFAFAAIVQLFTPQVRDRRALLFGFPLLVVALSIFALALLFASIVVLVLAAALLGIAVGLAFMGSVTLIDRIAPDRWRGEILSAFYIAGYTALAVPTVGVAFASERVGLGAAAAAFGITLGLFAVVGWVATWRTPTPPGGGGRP